MPKNKTLIFTATYNEAENVHAFCRQVLGLNPNYDLLIVDDNSPDGTGKILKALCEKEPRLKYLGRPRKLGLGTAHQLAMAYAIRNAYASLVTMDADLSHQPQDIPRLLDALETSDFAIGSRYLSGGQCNYTGYRKYISVLGNFAARILLNCPLHEFTTSFRAFRVSEIQKMGLFQLSTRGYSFFLDVVFRIHSMGWRVKEIPIHFLDRTKGRSKLPRFEILNGMLRLATLFLSRFKAKPTVTNRGLSPADCYQCGDAHCVQIFAKAGASERQVDDFKCTTLNHDSKPEVVRCLKCALEFVPEREKIEEFYTDVVDESYLEFKEARYQTFENTYQKISNYLSPRKRVLEVGCYCGLFLDTLKRHGVLNAEGIEPSKWAAQYARSELGLNVHTGSLSQVREKLDRYDVVTMWDVFEHLVDPNDTLDTVSELLNDNGVFCFSTLDISNWFPRLMGQRWPWLMDMHLFYFTTPVLKDFLDRAGFELLSVQEYSHYISAKYLAKKVFALSPVQLPKSVTDFVEKLVPRWVTVPFRFGDIKLYSARKRQGVAFPVPKPVRELGIAQIAA